jgi:hypothetical protein
MLDGARRQVDIDAGPGDGGGQVGGEGSAG